jgi:GNAT superfamily N-acetyltransferase
VFAWASSSSAPHDLDAAAAQLGFEPWEQDAPCMVAELADLEWDALDRAPAGLVIEPVADDEALVAFGAAFSEGLGVPSWAGQAWVDATRSAGIGRTPWVPFLATLEGEPVATNMLFCGAGVASVFGVATVERHRGRGIGAAVTLAGLRAGLDAGYRYGVLFATDMGAPVYRRIGFRDAGVGISRWLWRAE